MLVILLFEINLEILNLFLNPNKHPLLCHPLPSSPRKENPDNSQNFEVSYCSQVFSPLQNVGHFMQVQ